MDELLDIGVEQVVFHAETQPHIDGMLNRIHAKGAKAGVALKPATPLSTVEYVLEKCDTVLLMLINPGYAFVKGEKQVAYADRKIRELRRMIDERGAGYKDRGGRTDFAPEYSGLRKERRGYFRDRQHLPGPE